ncbi:phage tail tube protein [Agromyces lapidis]|uniref:Phage tail tube protein n=1 Tax=Agromyces lapidis TaxID=279574 RepID=A0ABV5SMH0_9MICO|nr:phage tail tube protein [Agromyces lapidis]
MTTQLDASVGFKKETTFGTYVAPDKFVEHISQEFAWEPEFSEGPAFRYGRRMQRADRRVKVKESVSGSVEVEATTKCLGALFEAALGAATSTVASGAAYQQLFTPTATDPLPSYTIQTGVPLVGGGANQPVSYLGMVCSGFELSAQNGAVPTLKFNFVGKGADTAQSFATPSYPASYELLDFVGSSIRIGGSVTPPTTTALASGGTAAANVTDIDMTFENGLDDGGFYLGGSGKRGRKPVVGARTLTGTMTVEYDSNTLRDAFLNQTDLALVLKFAHPVAITGAFYPTLEITIPVIRLDGEVPKPSGDGVVTQSIGFTALEGAAAHPIYVAIVTAETAI